MTEIVDYPTGPQCETTLKEEWGLEDISEAIPEHLCSRADWTSRWYRALDTLCRAMTRAPAVELMEAAAASNAKKHVTITALEKAMKDDPTVSASDIYKQRYGKAQHAKASKVASAEKRKSVREAAGASDPSHSSMLSRKMSKVATTATGGGDDDPAGASGDLQDVKPSSKQEVLVSKTPQDDDRAEDDNEVVEPEDLVEEEDSTKTHANTDLENPDNQGIDEDEAEFLVYRIGPSKGRQYLGRTIARDDNRMETPRREDVRQGRYISAPIRQTRHVYSMIDSVKKLHDWQVYDRDLPVTLTHDTTNKQLSRLLSEVTDLMKAREFIQSTDREVVEDMDKAEAAFIASIAEAKATYAQKLEEHGFLPACDDWAKYKSTNPSRYGDGDEEHVDDDRKRIEG